MNASDVICVTFEAQKVFGVLYQGKCNNPIILTFVSFVILIQGSKYG